MNIKEFANLVDEFTIDNTNKYMCIRHKGLSFNVNRMEYPLDCWYEMFVEGVAGTQIYFGIEKPLSNIIAYPVFHKILMPSEDEDFKEYIKEIEEAD